MVVIGYGMYGESFIVTVIVYPVISSVTTFLMVPENIMRRPRTVSARRLGVRREISDFMLNLANKIINGPGNEKHYYLDLARTSKLFRKHNVDLKLLFASGFDKSHDGKQLIFDRYRIRELVLIKQLFLSRRFELQNDTVNTQISCAVLGSITAEEPLDRGRPVNIQSSSQQSTF
eukprot:177740_1